jgi:hypothetical protein
LCSIDHQRIPFNLRDEAKGLLGLWFGERWSKWFTNTGGSDASRQFNLVARA